MNGAGIVTLGYYQPSDYIHQKEDHLLPEYGYLKLQKAKSLISGDPVKYGSRFILSEYMTIHYAIDNVNYFLPQTKAVILTLIF